MGLVVITILSLLGVVFDVYDMVYILMMQCVQFACLLLLQKCYRRLWSCGASPNKKYFSSNAIQSILFHHWHHLFLQQVLYLFHPAAEPIATLITPTPCSYSHLYPYLQAPHCDLTLLLAYDPAYQHTTQHMIIGHTYNIGGIQRMCNNSLIPSHIATQDGDMYIHTRSTHCY